MMGKLTWQAIPWDNPLPLFAGSLVVLAVICVAIWIALKGYVPYLWREWITSVDHKRIGVMYTLLGCLMMLRGFIDAIMMRSQQSFAFHADGYLPPYHFDQIFSAHGTIMIFFAAAVHDRPHEFRGAATARRARCRLPDFEQYEFLADLRWRVAY